MTCQCGGGGCCVCRPWFYAVSGCPPQPCPGTFQNTGRYAYGTSYVKKQMLQNDIGVISKAFHDLAALLIAQSAQTTVLTTQKPLLITALTTYGTPALDAQTAFDRDDAISAVMNAIIASVGALSADPNYTLYTNQVTVLQAAISTYFEDVNTCV
jgi:hypothetical protein